MSRGIHHVLLLVAVLATGCAARAPTANARPPGPEVLASEPTLADTRFSVLAGFESDAEAVFVSSDPTPRIDRAIAHTGRQSLLVATGAPAVRVRLNSMLLGRSFPADWKLAGFWVRSDTPAEVVLSREVGGRTLTRRTLALPAGQWVEAMLEIDPPNAANAVSAVNANAANINADAATAATVAAANATRREQHHHLERGAVDTVAAANVTADAGVLRLAMADGSRLPELRLDDVICVDNRRVYVGDEPDDAPPQGWRIERCGFTLTATAPARFKVALRAAPAEGWRLREANDFRARFQSSGKTRLLTVYPDGRAYWDGQYRPVGAMGSANDELAAQHRTPAKIEVSEEMAKVDRSTDGDANHDGYNECRGAYQLRAFCPRLSVHISPTTPALVNPVFEIAGLPDGPITATVDGRLIESVHRLDDGVVLLEIPARLTRPFTLDLRVKGQ